MVNNPERKKVLILYNNLFHYRIPIFKLVSEKYDLTVAFSIGPDVENAGFKILRLGIFKFKRFVIHKRNIFKLCQQFDVVIALGDISWIKFSTLVFHRKRLFKLIFWSPGVSASYDKKFDAISRWDSVRDFFYKRADALIFYTDYPIKKYISRGFNSQKLFVAPNTVEVYNDVPDVNAAKDSLLFIGSLYKEKGIMSLLESYKSAYIRDQNIPSLNIVGDGADFENIKAWIATNSFKNKIFLHGLIYDPKIKSNFFKRAYACISPVQAGLSVLESMGYGVPFITMHDSITGGERLSILNGINGILMTEIGELTDIIIDISRDPQKYIKMGEQAVKHYRATHKPEDMANGILASINCVLK